MPSKISVIPANTNEPMKYVVIYARVSSNSMEQLDSLKTQISGLTKFISGQRNWKLVDVHIDIASSKKGSVRPAFNQMIEECKAGLTDIVVVKNISRLDRDKAKRSNMVTTRTEHIEVTRNIVLLRKRLDFYRERENPDLQGKHKIICIGRV